MSHSPAPLSELAEAFSEADAARICIQDVSGEYGGLIDSLPYEMKFHLGPVCRLIKPARRGMEFCAACKYKAIDCARLMGRPYVGCCRFGVWEVVWPVYVRDRISCVIFIGNLLHDADLYRERIRSMAPVVGADTDALLELERELCPTGGDFSPYFRRARLLADYLTLLAEHSPGMLSRPDADALQCRSTIVKSVISYTGLYYSDPLTLHRLAQNHYVSENWLGRLFRRETGMSFSEYLHHVRTRAACEQLRNSSESIAQISAAVGYDSVSYFNRCFKRITNMTPGEYRLLYTGPWRSEE